MCVLWRERLTVRDCLPLVWRGAFHVRKSLRSLLSEPAMQGTISHRDEKMCEQKRGVSEYDEIGDVEPPRHEPRHIRRGSEMQSHRGAHLIFHISTAI